MPSEPDTTPSSIEKLRATSTSWIASADAKATALLGISNILLGAVFLSDIKSESSLVYWGSIAFIVIVVGLHLFVGFGVLWPRTDRKSILNDALFSTSDKDSPSYFGDIVKLKHDDFIALMRDGERQRQDAEEQAYILAFIANKKMIAFQWAIGLFAFALFIFGSLAISKATCKVNKPATSTPTPAHNGTSGSGTGKKHDTKRAGVGAATAVKDDKP